MKFLQNIFDKMRPDFEKGGKFEKLYPLFEAKESFTFVTRDRTKSGAHIRDALDTKICERENLNLWENKRILKKFR